MGLFDDVLAPSRTAQATIVPTAKGRLFADVLDGSPVAVRPPASATTVSRGDFGLGTAETIGAPPPLGLRDFFPATTEAAQTFLRGPSLIDRITAAQRLGLGSPVSPAVGLDVLRTVTAPIGLIPETRRLAEGRPFPPTVRQLLSPEPSPDPLENLARMGVETAALNVAPAAIRGVARGLEVTGVAGRARQLAETRRLLATPVEELVTQARASGERAVDILGALRRAGSPKFRQVFEAVQRQRQAPRQPIALLTSQRGAVPLPDIRPGDLVRFGKQVRRVVSVDPQTLKAVLAVGAGRTITAPLAQLTRTQPFESEAIRPLTRIRLGFEGVKQQAIQAVTRDLAEQSRILSTESGSLKRRVLEAGGIRPTLAGGLREELQAIRPFLRQRGRAIDDLATELGFEDGEALRQALITVQQAKRPTLAQLRQQATQIVDSEGGSLILQALQTKGATGQSIKRIVREVTQQTESEVSRGLRQVRGLLRGAERKALTPTQIARVARAQRIEPGATVTGPRGGEREAPLATEEIAQVQQRIGGIVPRRPEITGQPPRIPRKKALVRADFSQHPFKDLTEFQSAPLSGLDPRRATRLVDGEEFGPVRQLILDPVQAGVRAGRSAGQRDLAVLHRAVPNLRPVSRVVRGPQESEQLFDFIEGRLDPKAITPRLLRAAGVMRETYDRLLGALNHARTRQGKVPIQPLNNYITHIQKLNLLDDFYYGLNNVPDDALTIPTITTHPNSPFFQFALKRLGGPHAKDAVEAFTRYVVKANAVIAHAPVLQATRPLVTFLPPRAQGYFTQYLDEVLALKKAKADTMAPRPLLNAISWLRRQVGGGAILGNLSSVFNQLWTVPATVARVGPMRAIGAGGELLRATGKDIVNRLILRVGARDYAQAILDLHKPDVRDFIFQHSPLLQNRRFEIEFDPTTMRRIDKVLGALIQSVDQEMVRLAWLAQFRKSSREGKAFTQAVREAGETAFATQSGYTPEDLPPAFRSQIAGAFAQFQNSINNVFNFLRFDVGIQPLTMARDFRGHVGRNPRLFKQALLFFGTVYAMKMLYEHAGIPSAVDGLEDLVPLWGMAEYGPPAFWSPADAMLSLATADTPLERAKATAKLKRASFLLLGRGGNQLRKTIDGIIGISKGGKFDKRGRLIFPIKGTLEQARAILFGIYGTKAGQAFIRRGFKPEPKRFPLTTPRTPQVAATATVAPMNGRILRRGRLFEDVLR